MSEISRATSLPSTNTAPRGAPAIVTATVPSLAFGGSVFVVFGGSVLVVFGGSIFAIVLSVAGGWILAGSVFGGSVADPVVTSVAEPPAGATTAEPAAAEPFVGSV